MKQIVSMAVLVLEGYLGESLSNSSANTHVKVTIHTKVTKILIH